MRLTEIVSALIARVTGRIFRLAAAALTCALFLLVTIYHLAVAGTVALEAEFGPISARLIMAGIFALAAGIAAVVLWRMRARRAPSGEQPGARLLDGPSGTHFGALAMIVEAVLLGYSMSRKNRPDG
jgi:heme/copper-type cytochrome/quinol oxidase subunit 2